MKITLIVLISLLVMGGFATGLGVWFSRSGLSEDQTTVRTERVGRGDLIEFVSAPGIIEPETKVSISAKIAARVIDLPHKEGDRVYRQSPTTQPSVLVRLDSKDLEAVLRAAQARYAAQQSEIKVQEARLESQQANIDSLNVQLVDAQRTLVRQKQLLGSQDVSQAAVDEAQARFDQLNSQLIAAQHDLRGARAGLQASKHQLEAAEAEIAKATDNLSYTTIVSPIDGVVTRLNAEVGELVVTGTMNNQGTVIMEVADLSRMLLRARVDETSIANVKVGQRATVRIPAYKDEEFSGTVQSVALANTEETRGAAGNTYFKCEILIDTKGRTIPSGLTADVEIETKRFSGVLKIPSQAVLARAVDELPGELRNAPEVDHNKSMATVVYRLIDGKAIVTPVRIGTSDLTHTAVESGLSEDDTIVTGPFKTLESLKHDQPMKAEASPTTRPTTSPATQPATTPS